jgi:excisionase family DNA binding protein
MTNPFESLATEIEAVKQQLGEIKEFLWHQPALKRNDEKPLSIKEACEYLKCSKTSIYKYTANKKLAFSKTGKFLFFKKEDLDAFMLGNRQETATDSISLATVIAENYISAKKTKK